MAKIEIELDPSKIDYTEINRQISEKLKEINVREEFDLDKLVEDRLNSKIKDEVKASFAYYINEWTKLPNSEGQLLVKSTITEEIKTKCIESINEVLNEMNLNEMIKEIVSTTLPSVITHELYAVVRNDIQNAICNSMSIQQDDTLRRTNEILNERLRRLTY